MDDSQKLTAIASLLGELLAALKVNVLRGTISVNGGGIEELKKFLASFEERFKPFKPENPFRTVISSDIELKKIKST